MDACDLQCECIRVIYVLQMYVWYYISMTHTHFIQGDLERREPPLNGPSLFKERFELKMNQHHSIHQTET